MDIIKRRGLAVNTMMSQVASILNCQDNAGAIDKAKLDAIRKALLRLSSEDELFPQADFPKPVDQKNSSNMFELSRDESTGATLYISIAPPGLETPPHDHATWAVIAGHRGVEFNQLYRLSEDGTIIADGSFDVKAGAAITLMPEDVHSIRILEEGGPFLSFHLYGMRLQEMTRRRFFDSTTRSWKFFSHQPNIRKFDLEKGHAIN